MPADVPVAAPALALFAFALAALALAAALIVDIMRSSTLPRALLALGCASAALGALLALPAGSAPITLMQFGDWQVRWQADAAALWLMLPAPLPALFASLLGGAAAARGWAAGAAMSLLGALGVFTLRDGASVLIAWELMGLGGAVMLLAEHRNTQAGHDNLFMLALLEVGGVALLLAVATLGGDLDFASYARQWGGLAPVSAFGLGLLWLIGFGAKLGLLPFYEWYPGAYGSGSGASGALMSGVVMNAAYFALGRALLRWMGTPPWLGVFGVIVLAAGVCSAMLAILYAFQQNDWRRLLAFSSAESAAIAVTALGAALVFRAGGQDGLAALAWIVGVLHLMGHSLAKGALFFAADSAAALQGNRRLQQNAILRHAPLTVGVGAVLAAMSLAAMPPTAGFVSEWYLFQTLFHDFTLAGDGSRIALALAGAGLALTAAAALATMVKLVGVGLLGQNEAHAAQHRKHQATLGGVQRAAVLTCGLAVPAFAVALISWLPLMGAASWPQPGAPAQMVHGWLLVPLSAGFAFISPAKLMLAAPLLALLPTTLLWVRRRYAVRRAPIWCGGEDYAAHAGATTALAFSNALRVFYSFVYRPTNAVSRQFEGPRYFLKELQFDYDQAPVFGRLLFEPAVRAVRWLSDRLRFLQNGLMNAYLAYIGLLLLIILALALVWTPPA